MTKVWFELFDAKRTIIWTDKKKAVFVFYLIYITRFAKPFMPRRIVIPSGFNEEVLKRAIAILYLFSITQLKDMTSVPGVWFFVGLIKMVFLCQIGCSKQIQNSVVEG